MIQLPDFSHWWTRERLEHEDHLWANNPEKPRLSRIVENLCERRGLNSIVEFGCGTGHTPAHLLKHLDYTGVDASQDALKLAKQRNPDRRFTRMDIRSWPCQNKKDVVIAIAFLKHFGLHEWRDIFNKVLNSGRFAVFDMNIGEKTKDDGKEFHHVIVTNSYLMESIKQSGHEVYLKVPHWNPVEPLFITRKL